MKTLFIIITMLFLTIIVNGQQVKRAYFFGIQPSVTKEKFYDDNEFDVNVIPLVFQTGISKRVDFRITTLANYHFGKSAQFSDLGIELATPIFWKKKQTSREKSKGLFISPVIGLSNNLMNDHNTVNTIVEAGYFFLFGKKLALSASLQYGRSFFYYHNGESDNVQHFGVKVNVGLWL